MDGNILDQTVKTGGTGFADETLQTLFFHDGFLVSLLAGENDT